MTVTELFERGGVTMWPLFGLSLLATGVICDRLWFWFSILSHKQETVKRVLQSASRFNWELAAQLSLDGRKQPVGRFLHAPLRYPQLEPEVFCLALEVAAEEELTRMRRGDKVLEAAIALAPLLGLLGTVLGLMRSLSGIKLGEIGKASTAGLTLGISESLISTATGLAIAITSLAFYRLFQALVFKQAQIFRRAGNELELLYRQYWSQITTSTPAEDDISDPVSDSPPVAAPLPPPISQPPLTYEDLFGQ
ncbi:MotA/TolQ/ExbB proton channel family protein [Merismopedia glauca]|uniref:Biopolymer transporter ExbB n=1 Tax=Merismopedia glauca CCAP 1448/3 TaxID=1296344 RepID=A0A2T1C751_9CYAN|nr:MotA/TolQ/ExbB proton channel family protein [Merismopedia glauca]PSB04079.1 biopolymer transporter ExbB [Merismopedia glauca CCAP 1448/3]